MRYLKDIGKFSDFKRITANSDPMFKKHLKKQFDLHPGFGWVSFFSYTFLVGKRYGEYGQDFFTMANGWTKFYWEQRKISNNIAMSKLPPITLRKHDYR